jgi:hypothetical protein
MATGGKPKGGKREGAGRKAGKKNRLTVLRQTKQAEAIAQIVDSGKPLAVTVLQKAMEFAEGAVAAYRPTMNSDIAAGKTKNPDGSPEEFGKWFDRWFKCIETMARYQTPTMRAIDAPTPPPDAGTNKKRFTLRVFDGGRVVANKAANEDAA